MRRAGLCAGRAVDTVHHVQGITAAVRQRGIPVLQDGELQTFSGLRRMADGTGHTDRKEACSAKPGQEIGTHFGSLGDVQRHSTAVSSERSSSVASARWDFRRCQALIDCQSHRITRRGKTQRGLWDRRAGVWEGLSRLLAGYHALVDEDAK